MQNWQFWTLLAASVVNLTFTLGVFLFASEAQSRLQFMATNQLKRLLGEYPETIRLDGDK